MKPNFKVVTHMDFLQTCSGAEVHELPNLFYKFVNMFGEKTLIYWKETGRISTRNGHKEPKN